MNFFKTFWTFETFERFVKLFEIFKILFEARWRIWSFHDYFLFNLLYVTKMPKLKKTKKSQNIEEEQTEKFDSSLIVIKEKKRKVKNELRLKCGFLITKFKKNCRCVGYESNRWRWSTRFFPSRNTNGNDRVPLNPYYYYAKWAIIKSTFLCYLIFCFVVAIGSMSTSMYYLTKIMKSQFVETEFETASGKDITFDDIKNAADFWAVS